MRPKLFLMLAVVALLAALLAGNPFLGKCRPAGLAVPLDAAPPATPVGEAVLPVAFAQNRSGPRDANEGRIPAAAMGQATPVGLVLNQPDGLTKGAARGKAAAPQCPDPLLRPLVVDVESDASGAPIWVLEDGRRLCRNPVAGKEPLLVPAPPRKKMGS
ncbi:MAG TPA: hypothetical protein VFD82_19695 [Planctomycetota bacterium]|nr:hypothetical protein [Planctomycetota bacterium]